jgi:hypothetical protein
VAAFFLGESQGLDDEEISERLWPSPTFARLQPGLNRQYRNLRLLRYAVKAVFAVPSRARLTST